jgi:hypothetical protein
VLAAARGAAAPPPPLVLAALTTVVGWWQTCVWGLGEVGAESMLSSLLIKWGLQRELLEWNQRILFLFSMVSF